MKTKLILVAIVASCSLSFAQTKDDGQELINRFFELYKNEGYESALKYTLSTNKWIHAKGDEMDNLIVQLEKEVKVMGEYLGYEAIKSKRVGKRFRIVNYLVYYQRDPVRFTFELYKNNLGWEISNFVFDFKFDEEVEESMKLTK
jgi:hypothetical protein